MECCGGQGQVTEIPHTEVTHHLEPDLRKKEPHLLASSDARFLFLHVTVTICCPQLSIFPHFLGVICCVV